MPLVFPPAASPDTVGELQALAGARAGGPGMVKWAHYYDIYERHLARFRASDVHVVEIGVYGGGSLSLWRSYFGEGAQITGVDIDPRCSRFAASGIEIVIGDQADRGFWRSFVAVHPRIDVVIDDGGHQPEQQAATLESLLPYVQPGGVYICEDIHGAYHPFHAFVEGLTRPLSEIPGLLDTPTPASGLQRQVGSVHHYPLLTVIEKNESSAGTFETCRYGSEFPDRPSPGSASQTSL
jgi:hypothetical protein